MARPQTAAQLGTFLADNEDRIQRRAAKLLKYELDEGLSREHRARAIPSYVGELATLLLQRGEDAPRLWGEAVRHHGGVHFELRHDIGDLLREFKVLHLTVADEWQRRSGPMEYDVAMLLADCMGEGAASACADYVKHLRGQQVEFRESALIETILEHLDEGIILVEADGTISFATRPASLLLGPGLELVLGQPFTDPSVARLYADLRAVTLDGTPLRPEMMPAFVTLRTGHPPPPLLARVQRPEGERILEFWAIPIWIDETAASRTPRDLRGVIGTLRDRTEDIRKTEELHRANRELAELHTRMLQRSRAQAMGELATGAAHAFNNLLNAMHLRLRLLSENPGPEQVEALGRTISDLAELVARLQQFSSRRQAGPAEAVDLDRLAREALALVRPEGLRAGEGPIHLQVELGAPTLVRANAAELQELLVSLLLYAREQVAGGGELAVHTALTDRGQIQCRLTCRTHGTPAVALALEPFLGSGAPTSLALAASSAGEALERWGGQLESRLNPDGAEFTLSFRTALEPAAPPPRMPGPEPETGAGRRRVLVVDDDADNATMLAEVLAAEGHATVTASTAREALELWRSRPFDVALVDLLMPEMNGTEIAAEFLKTRPSARIALVTGWELDPEQRRTAPVHAVFRKPVDLAQLLEFLQPPAVPPDDRPAAPA